MAKSSPHGASRRTYWWSEPEHEGTEVRWDGEKVCSEMQYVNDNRKHVICIAENVGSGWASYIRNGMDLEPKFFDSHLKSNSKTKGYQNPRGRSLVVSYSPADRQPDTLISYYRISVYVCLILVDGDPEPAVELQQDKKKQKQKQSGRNRTCLRLKVLTNNESPMLPPLFELNTNHFDLFQHMKESMANAWVHKFLFLRNKRAIREHALLYILAGSLWSSNMVYLNEEVKRISFRLVQKPQKDTDTLLHQLREDLDFLRTEVKHALRYAPLGLEEYFARDEASTPVDNDSTGSHGATPIKVLRNIEEDAATLEGFLNNTLNLVMASIAMRDSERASMLTWMAAIYVPLSFVTGIFGMNLRELNDSSLPIWVCFEVLGVVLVLTIVLVWVIHRLRVLDTRPK